jgi:hypothetical protein
MRPEGARLGAKDIPIKISSPKLQLRLSKKLFPKKVVPKDTDNFKKSVDIW